MDRGFSKNAVFEEIVRLEKKFFPKYHYNVKDVREFHRQSKGYSLILSDNDKVAGYLIPVLFHGKNYLQILTIAINKIYQKKGYGAKLIKKCEETAKSLKINKVIIRADVQYPILKTLKNLEYHPMKLKEISQFIKEGIFSDKDYIGRFTSKKLKLFSKVYIITKGIGKKNPFSFIPMIKRIG